MKASLSSKVFQMKISFHSYANKTNFHVNSFALSLTFIVRFEATRKWLIATQAIYEDTFGCTSFLWDFFKRTLTVFRTLVLSSHSLWTGSQLGYTCSTKKQIELGLVLGLASRSHLARFALHSLHPMPPFWEPVHRLKFPLSPEHWESLTTPL